MPPTESRTDADLVAAANDGDEGGFVGLYERYRDWVVRLATRFTANPDDALDVLQETFSYVLRKFPGFELTASMTTFLYPVVRNLSLAALRKRRRMPLGEEALLNAVPSRESPGGGGEELAKVMSALPVTHREVILLRFVDGLSLEEIAAAMNIPLGTVKSRLHNALSLLRKDERMRRYFEIE